MSDVDYRIIFENFHNGRAPLSHLDASTFIGDRGQASEQLCDVISKPGFLTQGPALANLTNGDDNGVVTELIRAILDIPVSSTTTYALGATKMFKLSSTTVVSGGSPSFPQTVSTMTGGESLIRLNDYVYGFYNKSSGGDILRMTLSTEAITNNWGSSTDAALQNAPHPAAFKEDVIVFGNGRYAGVYIQGLNSLTVDKLDFGAGAEVADVVFHANAWWIAVNYGSKRSQIYKYDGSALSNILLDEAGIGPQRIGFLFVKSGAVWVVYTDATSGGYAVGYLMGRELKALRFFSGSLPNHRQKTLYKNTLIFASGSDIWSCGASVDQLPIQVSKLATGGYATLGAVAAPFGAPMVASTNNTNYRLAKFDGYATDGNWKTIFVDTTLGRNIGNSHTVIVYTKPLGASSRADVTLEGNQGQNTMATTLQVSGENKTRHVFTNVDLVNSEDVRAVVDFSNGDSSDDCPIRKIEVLGAYVGD